ncbi:MAG: exodeoxyribonuclease VII large subunit [Treponema sp.]|nr:exodeoxyribonuclease VII large subunit [Treponema sp.]
MQSQFSPQDQIFSVSQITSFIKEILENSFRTIKIEGEISNWKPSSSGHIYFTLKDANSQISAVMFRSSAYSLTFKPKDGDKVTCTGSITVYAQRGNYQIIVNKIEQMGSGNILQMLEERKKKLAAQGLFDQENKKPLPKLPKKIGVITSPTGAALRDILQIIKRRNPHVDIIILPAIVQGNEAPATLVKMLEIANFYKVCDLLIIGRGGGSLEDLLPFSDEAVVRAVAASKIPVISAVGHQIDWALCDYAADQRAATPSAAAEMAVPLYSDLIQAINYYKDDICLSMNHKIEKARYLIKSFDQQNLLIQFRNIEQPLSMRFEQAKENLYKNLTDKIKDLKNRIQNNVTILENASPQTILDRGYSMVTDENNNIIRDSKQISKDDKIIIRPAKGQIISKVLEN